MYEHPIKRAGLSFNRILFSNTKMVQNCFPKSVSTRYNLSFVMKSYENGKMSKMEEFTSADLDNVFPPTKAAGVVE